MEESEIHQKIVLNLSEVQIETIRNLFGFYNLDFDDQLDQNFGGNLQNVGKVTEEKGVQTDDQTLQDESREVPENNVFFVEQIERRGRM
ncbi:hypothetical protein KUTeg_013617 [Tegillarca granosa]|uniref:Uncharacterized protein n=1 Tax=Tegillarca granosa TaxID=220873 RepID=A0ABQ9EZM2_TEGGR|nr:hypothetical protein KUTeg_013617 [Tegillarca granosa]